MCDWADLPEGILGEILLKLFGKDGVTFSLVCKSWNKAALANPYHQSPWLMFYQKSAEKWKFFQYNRGFSMEFDDAYDAEILCSKYGWLLMSHDIDDLFFFNPFKKRSFEVPRPKERYETFCFFHPPTSSDCVIIGLVLYELSVYIGMLNWGEDEWEEYKYDSGKPFLPSLCTPILRGEALYLLDVKGNIGAFNIKERNNWIVHTNCLSPVRLQCKLRQHFLIKLDGEEEEEALLAVFVAGDIKKVSVYKFFEPDMKWNLVKDLGDKMLFVSRVASFAVTAPLKSMANTIYFAKLHGHSGIFYSLNTQKYHSFDGNYSSRKCYNLTELNFAAWIMPSSTFD